MAAGTAELNVVVNLISKIGTNLGPLKKDAQEVSRLLENLLSSPVGERGKGFLALFDIKASDSPKKVISDITAVVQKLSDAIKGPEGKTIIDQIGGPSAKATLQFVRDLGKEAKGSVNGVLAAAKASAEAVEAGARREGAARQQAAKDATSTATQSAKEQIALDNEVSQNRIRQIEGQLAELQRLKDASRTQLEGLQPGAASSREDLKEDIRSYNATIKVLKKEYESLKATAVTSGQQAAAGRAQATEAGAAKEVAAVRAAGEQEVAAGRATNEQLAQLVQKFAQQKKVVKDGEVDATQDVAQQTLETYKNQRNQELTIAEEAANQEIRLAERVGDAVVDATARGNQARQQATKVVAETSQTKTKVKDAETAAQAILLIEQTLAQELEVIRQRLSQADAAVSTARVRRAQEVVKAISIGEEAAATRVIGLWNKVQEALTKLNPSASASEVTIKFFGEGSDRLPISEKIAEIKTRFSTLLESLRNAQVTISTAKTTEEITSAASAVRQLDSQIRTAIDDATQFNNALALDKDLGRTQKLNLQFDVGDAISSAKKALGTIEQTLQEVATKQTNLDKERIASAKRVEEERIRAEQEVVAEIKITYSEEEKAASKAELARIQQSKVNLNERLKLLAKETNEQVRYYNNEGKLIRANGAEGRRWAAQKQAEFAEARKLVADMQAELKKLGETEDYYVKFIALMQASPVRPFSEGVENIKKKLQGLSTTETLTIKFDDLKKLTADLDGAETALTQLRQRQNELFAAGRTEQRPQIQKQLQLQLRDVEDNITKQQAVYDKLLPKVTRVYAQVNDGVAVAMKQQRKTVLRETQAEVEEMTAKARTAASIAASKVHEAIGMGSRKGAKEAAASYDLIRREVDNLVRANSRAGQAVRDANKQMGEQAAGDARKSVKRIEEELGKLGVSWDDAARPGVNATRMWEDRMNSLSYRFTHVGFQLGIFGAAAMEAFKRPVEAAAELAKTVEYTSAILGGGTETVERLRKATLDYGASTIYSSQQVAEGIRALAQAGLDTEQSIAAVIPVLNLASAGMIDLEHAGRIAISTMYQFRLGLGDLPKIVQTIQAAANKTNAEVKDFGEALKNVGPTAASVGATLEDTVAILGRLSQAGLNGGRAGTQIRGLYRRLLEASSGSTKAGRIFEKLGLTVVDAAGNFKDFTTILGEFQKATEDMTQTQRAALVYQIFGQRAGGPAMIALLNGGAEAVEQLKETIAGAADAEEIAAKRAEGLWGSIEKLKQVATVFLQTIGYGEGSLLTGVIKRLTSFLDSMRQIIDSSPGLQKAISGFLSLAGIAGAISLAGAAFALMFGNMLSVLGVAGPLKRIFTTLTLTLRGIPPVIARNIAAGEANTLTMAQQATVAQGLTVANGSLAASFNALGIAMKAVIGLAVVAALYEVYKAVDAGIKANEALNDQIKIGEKGIARFRAAIEKPIANKEQFALMTEEERRAEIKRLSEVERFYLNSIHVIQNKIDKKKAFTFGLGNTSALEKDLAKQQKLLDEASAKWSYITLHPKVDIKEAETDVRQSVDRIVGEFDILFGNKKLGIKKFDVSKVLTALDKTQSAYARFTQSIERTSSGVKDSFSESSRLAENLRSTFKSLGVDISSENARELQDTRELNAQKLNVVKDYYAAAMQATRDYTDEATGDEHELTAAREAAYEETLGALDTMYQEATTKMEEYAADVLKAEENLAKERVDAYNWYLEQTEVADKLKSQKRKLRENEEARSRLWELYNTQVADGDLKLASQTLKKITTLVEEANKQRRDDVADAIEGEKKKEQELNELRTQLSEAEKARRDRAEEKIKANGEKEEAALARVTEAEERLADLQENLHEAETAKQRLSITHQIEAQERKIIALREKAKDVGEKENALTEKGETETREEKRLKRRIEAKEKELKADQAILSTNSDLVRESIAAAAEKEAEAEAGLDALEVARQEQQLASETQRVMQERIRMQERFGDLARAHLRTWQETQLNAKLTKDLIIAINDSIGKLTLADDAGAELKRLQQKVEGSNIAFSITATGDDKRTVEIMDLLTGKAIQTIEIPIDAKADQGKYITQLLDAVQAAVASTPLKILDEKGEKDVRELAKVGTQEQKMRVSLDATGVQPVLTDVQRKIAQTRLVATFQADMDEKTRQTYNDLLNLKQHGIVLPFRVQGSDELKQVTLSAKELSDLEKYYGGKFSLSVVMSAEGIATLPGDFEAVVAAIRADAQLLSTQISDELTTQVAAKTTAKLPEAEAAGHAVGATIVTGVQAGINESAGEGLVKPVIDQLNTRLPEAAHAAGSEAARRMGYGFEGTWTELSVFERWGDSAGQAIGRISLWLAEALQSFGEALTDKYTWIAIWDTVKFGFTETIKGLQSFAIQIFKDMGKMAYDQFVAPFLGLRDFLRGLLKGFRFTFSGSAEEAAPTPQGRWGGLVRGMARGGHLPGYGGGDRRLTLLEDGEYVLPKEAVRGMGLNTLHRLRAMFMAGTGMPNFNVGIPRMAAGGAVGANAAPDSLGVYTLNWNMGGKTYPLSGSRVVISQLLEALRREGMTTR